MAGKIASFTITFPSILPYLFLPSSFLLSRLTFKCQVSHSVLPLRKHFFLWFVLFEVSLTEFIQIRYLIRIMYSSQTAGLPTCMQIYSIFILSQITLWRRFFTVLLTLFYIFVEQHSQLLWISRSEVLLVFSVYFVKILLLF